MGVPTSEVGYTAAMSRREDHEVHKDMWWGHWTQKRKRFNPNNDPCTCNSALLRFHATVVAMETEMCVLCIVEHNVTESVYIKAQQWEPYALLSSSVCLCQQYERNFEVTRPFVLSFDYLINKTKI